MADEPLEVQRDRVRWEGINKLAATVANVLLAAVVAVQAYYQAQVSARVERVEQRTQATGEAVDHLKANARVVMYAPEAKKE